MRKLKDYEESELPPIKVIARLEELKRYKTVGPTPEQLIIIDDMFLEKCRQIEILENKLKKYEECFRMMQPMTRLTTDKPAAEMTMLELIHNSCYIRSDWEVRYRDYTEDIDAMALTRELMLKFGNWDKNSDELADEELFSETIMENLQYGLAESIEGLIAAFYRNICGAADLRYRLMMFEDIKASNDANGWISEKEPDEPGEYNVVIKGSSIATTLRYDEGDWFDDLGDCYEISAWQPLPVYHAPKETAWKSRIMNTFQGKEK